MKLIGVTGQSGVGKSTFSEYLAEHDEVGIIYADNIVGNLKRKYFGMVLQPDENNTTEHTKANPKIKTGIKKFFYENKFIFKPYARFRSMLVQKGINEQIEEYKKEGKKIVVIDDWLLTTHENLYPQLNKVYVLSRKFTERRRGVAERDNSTREEMGVSDLPYALKYVKKPTGGNVVEISNRGSLEELKQKADEEYDKVREISFDERYAVSEEQLTPLEATSKTISRVKELGERTRVEE